MNNRMDIERIKLVLLQQLVKQSDVVRWLMLTCNRYKGSIDEAYTKEREFQLNDSNVKLIIRKFESDTEVPRFDICFEDILENEKIDAGCMLNVFFAYTFFRESIIVSGNKIIFKVDEWMLSIDDGYNFREWIQKPSCLLTYDISQNIWTDISPFLKKLKRIKGNAQYYQSEMLNPKLIKQLDDFIYDSTNQESYTLEVKEMIKKLKECYVNATDDKSESRLESMLQMLLLNEIN